MQVPKISVNDVMTALVLVSAVVNILLHALGGEPVCPPVR
jgi:hypothetical protein